MLRLKAEATAGMDLRRQMLPEMLALAKRTDCCIEVKANGIDFWVYPNDSLVELQSAYDRLYPESQIVSTAVRVPVPKRSAS